MNVRTSPTTEHDSDLYVAVRPYRSPPSHVATPPPSTPPAPAGEGGSEASRAAHAASEEQREQESPVQPGGG
jgi:hypothetical protein